MLSDAARCDLELTVEVRRCPLQCKAGEDDGEEKKKKKKRKEDMTFIKFNNPHLTGGEFQSVRLMNPEKYLKIVAWEAPHSTL